MQINTISDFRHAVRNGPYVWPGGYPLYFQMGDGGALSFKAAKAERRNILEALRDRTAYFADMQWLPIACAVNWEDSSLTCDHTNERIESAYGED